MRVLGVAEKPSISKSVSQILSRGRFETNATRNKYIKNYVFQQNHQGQEVELTMTALVGHLMETDFTGEYRNWQSAPIVSLFEAPIVKHVKPDLKAIADNLQRLGRQCQMLVIWTDNDREGENIGKEVADLVLQVNSRIIVKRARFSVVQEREITTAWQRLGELDYRQAAAVDARSEMDLRIGAVFTRFQTLQLRNKFDELKDSKVISYGSCQFPTLGFIVDRYQRVREFKPEPFWGIDLSLQKEDTLAHFSWARGHLFDQHAVFIVYEMCVDDPVCEVKSVNSRPTSKWTPLPLTTIEMQKFASRYFRMSSDKIMTVAEKLYNQGIISYPRTETDSFDDKFELMPLIQSQAEDPRWGAYASGLVNGKFRKPRKGKNNDQAHPPIHPVRAATNLEGDEAKLFEFITRRFLACCSDAAKGHTTSVKIEVAGETFSTSGLMVLERNFLDVYTYEKWSDSYLPNFQEGERFQPTRLEMSNGRTSAPQMLSEADLIAIMDRNGIGTDATIHEHIKKIQEREYVNKEGIYFYPTTLGMALVKGYDSMDMNLSLSKPFLRSQMENNMKRICDGQKTKEQVIQESIEMYKGAFLSVESQARVLEQSCIKYFRGSDNDNDGDDPGFGHGGNNDDQPPPPSSRPRGPPQNRNNQPASNNNYPNTFPNNANNSNNRDKDDDECPPCECGMASAKRTVRKEGPNSGREFFTCSKQQTDASRCDLFQWADAPPNPSGSRTLSSFQSNSNFSNPNNSTNNPSFAFSNENAATDAPQCHCGIQAVERTVKKDGPNCGRNFYTCSKNQDDSSRCKLFEWTDQPSAGSSSTNFAPPQQVFRSDSLARPSNPSGVSGVLCSCGDEAVERTVRKEGPNCGRMFYVCRKPQSDTSRCDLFQWSDEAPSGASSATFSRFEANSFGQAAGNKTKCHCDLVAVMKTCSKSGQNSGRQFYTCTKASARCNFFQWEDEMGTSAGPSSRSMTGNATCYKCGEMGHFSTNCPQGGASSSSRNSSSGRGRGRGRGRGKSRGTGKGKRKMASVYEDFDD